ARMRPNRTTSSSGPEANPVPLIVNGDPGTATEEPSEAIVGAVVEPTANGVVLLAPPAGDVTLSGPVVAPAGTWTLNMVVLAATTAPGVPLNLTAFWLRVPMNAEASMSTATTLRANDRCRCIAHPPKPESRVQYDRHTRPCLAASPSGSRGAREDCTRRHPSPANVVTRMQSAASWTGGSGPHDGRRPLQNGAPDDQRSGDP